METAAAPRQAPKRRCILHRIDGNMLSIIQLRAPQKDQCMSFPHEHVVNHAIKDFSRKEKPSLLDWNHLKVLSQVQGA